MNRPLTILAWLLAFAALALLPQVLSVKYYLHLSILALIWVIVAQGQNLIQGFTGYVSIVQAGFMGIGLWFDPDRHSLQSADLGDHRRSPADHSPFRLADRLSEPAREGALFRDRHDGFQPHHRDRARQFPRTHPWRGGYLEHSQTLGRRQGLYFYLAWSLRRP